MRLFGTPADSTPRQLLTEILGWLPKFHIFAAQPEAELAGAHPVSAAKRGRQWLREVIEHLEERLHIGVCSEGDFFVEERLNDAGFRRLRPWGSQFGQAAECKAQA